MGMLGFDAKPIGDCYNSGYGKVLELRYADDTNALRPSHQYVPWVIVNGQPLHEDYENFLSYICKAYKGAVTHTACSDLSRLNAIETGGAKHSRTVSYNEVPKASTLGARVRSAVATWVSQTNMAALE